MGTFEIVMLLASGGGLAMVVGGMFLIYKGAMTLASAPGADALSLEFRKTLRVSTQAPGLGFFLIGLALLLGTLYFSRPNPLEQVVLYGRISGATDPITIRVSPHRQEIQSGSDGDVKFPFFATPKVLQFEATAPGYTPHLINVDVPDAGARRVEFQSFTIRRVLTEVPSNPANIEDLPAPAAGASKPSGFYGGPR